MRSRPGAHLGEPPPPPLEGQGCPAYLFGGQGLAGGFATPSFDEFPGRGRPSRPTPGSAPGSTSASASVSAGIGRGCGTNRVRRCGRAARLVPVPEGGPSPEGAQGTRAAQATPRRDVRCGQVDTRGAGGARTGRSGADRRGGARADVRIARDTQGSHSTQGSSWPTDPPRAGPASHGRRYPGIGRRDQAGVDVGAGRTEGTTPDPAGGGRRGSATWPEGRSLEEEEPRPAVRRGQAPGPESATEAQPGDTHRPEASDSGGPGRPVRRDRVGHQFSDLRHHLATPSAVGGQHSAPPVAGREPITGRAGARARIPRWPSTRWLGRTSRWSRPDRPSSTYCPPTRRPDGPPRGHRLPATRPINRS